MGMTITTIYGNLGVAAGMVAVLIVLLWVCDYFEERREQEELDRLMEAEAKKKEMEKGKAGQGDKGQQKRVGGKEGEATVNTTSGYNAESESLTMTRGDEPRATRVHGVYVGTDGVAAVAAKGVVEKETRDAEGFMGCVRGMQVS